ncbi:MAG: TonB-dependent receptor [Ignavibacteriaceae bacterium]
MRVFLNSCSIILTKKVKASTPILNLQSIFRLVLFMMIISSSLNNAQQSGIISGKIIDAQTGEALIGANIFLQGTTIGAASDIEGNFIISGIPAGVYTLTASMIGYSKMTVTDVVVEDDKSVKLDLALQTETYETEEVVVTARLILNNEASLLKNRQKSLTVSDAISSEQLSRNGSGDAGDALKKVVGSTVVDGKYVYVRGLGDRYSSTQLNGTELPSSDPNRKSFQLDLIPTNLLDNIVTVKTFTPDKPGNFTGGIVDIGTKTFPDKFILKFSGSSSYNSQTTFNNNFITYNGSSTDWLGTDDGTRDIPSLLSDPNIVIPIEQEARFDKEKAELLDAYSHAFNSIMDVKTQSVPVNQSYSLSIGDRIATGDESTFGYLASLSYKRNFSFYENGTVGRYKVTDLNADILDPTLLLNDTKGSSEANLGGLFTTAYNFNSTQQLTANIFYSKSGISTARSQQGSWPQEFGSDPGGPVFFNRVLSWIEREISSYQLRGQHHFENFLNLNTDWAASISQTTQDEPDFRLLSYSVDESSNGTNYIIVGSGFDDPSRYFRNLSDESQNYNLNFSLPFAQWDQLKSSFKFGVAYQKSTRVFNERIFSYNADNLIFNEVNGDLSAFFSDDYAGITSIDTLSNGNLKYTFGNIIKDNSKPKNNYDGKLEIFAAYGMFELPITKNLKFAGGARFETTDLSVISNDPTQSEGRIKVQDVLPSVNLIYELTRDMNLRLSGSQTIGRPNFREVAPYSTKEFVNDVELKGNPNLNRTIITNLDLRWEWFTNPGEVVALSGFYKKFKNPIELSFAEGSIASNPIVEFKNVDNATVAGVEFELRAGLGQIVDLLSGFSVGTNLSIIYSNIDIAASELEQRLAIDSSSSITRKLQGQSPYVFNLDITYLNEDWGTVAGLYLNTFGERLSKVSANVNPDVFEQPAPELNFTLSQKLIELLTINVSVKNLLNSSYKEVSRYKGNDFVYYEYKKGLSYSLGLTYNL